MSVALPSGQGTTTYVYQGNATIVTDPAGKWKKFINDAFGNLVQVIEPEPAGGADLNTYYTYDLLNHLTQVSMPRGTATQTRTFVYDSTTQRLMSATHPESGTVTFTYNGDGTVATKIDAKGQKVAYGYDSLQRPGSITVYPNGVTADPCQGVMTYYDSNPDDQGKGVPFTQNAANRVELVVWGGSACAGGYTYREAFSYSSAGKVLKQRLSVIKSSMQRDLDAEYGYNNEGQVTSVKYPAWDDNGSGSWQVVPGAFYWYTFDSMGRPSKMTDNDPQRPVDWVKDVLYGPAGNVTQTRYLETKGASAPQDVYYLQTHTYNTLFQLTRMTTVREGGGGGGTIMDIVYRFSATQNNGKITQHKDWVSGEEVTYQYDSLQRLIAATTTGPEWGQSFGYDGFGNLLSKSVTKGPAPTLSINVDGATNRITTSGFGYDANGNMTSIPGQSGVAYDALNRLTTASGDQYSYRPDNKRLWKKLPSGAEEIYFYSITGERLGAYQPVVSGPSLYLKQNSTNVYFAGTMIRSQGQAVVMDRMGSVRSHGGTSTRYFPYGEEQTSTANEKNKFGTYFRDGTTGLDYADQRYYGSGAGRFLSADPSGSKTGTASSQSWNRYGYVEGDPVNRIDPKGLDLFELGGAFERYFNEGISPYSSVNRGSWVWASLSGGWWPWSQGYNCYMTGREMGEDVLCPIWRATVYALAQAWTAAAAAGGGGGGGGGQPVRTPMPKFLRVTNDCYQVPEGGFVTRKISYELADDSEPPQFYRNAVVWEHLVGDLPDCGPLCSMGGASFDDNHSAFNLRGVQRMNVVQSFSARLPTGQAIPVFVRGFGRDYGYLDIVKTKYVIYINGNAGGRVDDKTGQLIKDTYKECSK